MEKARELLSEKEADWMEVYRDTGIPFYWLRKFKRGVFKNPSVNRVQFLYEHLSGRKLAL